MFSQDLFFIFMCILPSFSAEKKILNLPNVIDEISSNDIIPNITTFTVLKKNAYRNINLDAIQIISTNLTNIKTGAFRNVSVYTLDLSNNRIQTLEPGMFIKVTLDEFDLSNNRILKIEPNTFGDISSKHKLYAQVSIKLQRNRISSITKGVFDGTVFKYINLNNNPITYIEAGSFEDMPNLHSLQLMGCGLETIGLGIFSNLGSHIELNLSSNKINVIDRKAFQQTHFDYLNLVNNRLVNVTEDYFMYTIIEYYV